MIHRELTDPQLHEPKGASTAAAGTVYVADGEGSGVFENLQISNLGFTAPLIVEAALSEVSGLIDLDPSAVAADIDGELRTSTSFTDVNKNVKELATALAKLQEEFNKTVTNLQNTKAELEAIRSGLIDINILRGE